MNFSELLKCFNFNPTQYKSSFDQQDCTIQIYLNDKRQTVTVSYAYEDDYFSIDLENESGKAVGGAFEDCLEYELWNDLFTHNIVKI